MKGLLIIAGILALVCLVVLSIFVAKAPEITEAEEANLLSTDIN